MLRVARCLQRRCVSSYISVQERDPKAHKFLGQLFEIEKNVEKAVGSYKRSLELNPTQKDLVLKIAELICSLNSKDSRAEYWVDRASKLFPGNPVIYRLKEQLLSSQGEAGWNELLDLIQSELFARPNDVYVNIRLLDLFRSNKRLDEAVNHCLKPERRALRMHLEWCHCVVQVFKEYLATNNQGREKNWRTINKELLLAHSDVVLLTLLTKNVQKSKEALESFDQALLSVKQYVSGADAADLSLTFREMRGHYYMHAGTLLLKMAQQCDTQWKALIEPAALCYLLAYQEPKPKCKPSKGEDGRHEYLEGLACDRQSQSGHLLLTLSQGKEDFICDIIETFANPGGQSILLKFLFEENLSVQNSFMANDDVSRVHSQIPDLNELCQHDYGALRMHNGDLQHLTWLGLQWHFMATMPPLRKWLKQIFPRLPQETSRIASNTPDSICTLDLEVFLLGVVYTSYLQLQENNISTADQQRPRCLPLPICKQLCTERQRSWWDAVYSLTVKKSIPGTAAKLRLVIQHDLTTLRAQEKHGLHPALLVHWAKSLHKTGYDLNSFYDQKEYMGRCVHYWKKVLPFLDLVKQKRSIPEPVDPLFKHFHCKDVKVSEVRALEDEACIAFATLDLVDGKTEDAIITFESVKNVVSYWNLALIYQRKAEDIENDVLTEDEQEKFQNCLFKCKAYLKTICDEYSANPSIATMLPVCIESVVEMLDCVKNRLGEAPEDRSPDFIENHSIVASSAIKHSTPSPSKFAISPSKAVKFSPKTPPRWAEDQKSLLEVLCNKVEALKKEVHELKQNSSNASPRRWPNDGFDSDTVADGYQVSTSGSGAYYNQSPAYNSQHLLRPAANITPTKTSLYTMNRLPPQQHMYAYPQSMHTPPTQSSAACVFPQEIYGPPLRFESPATAILSPHNEEFYNYSAPHASTNPPLPEPGYFTKPSLAPQHSKSEVPKVVDFGKSSLNHSMPIEGQKQSPFIAPLQSTPAASTFKFNSNFKSNDGDFTFSSSNVPTQANSFTCSESLLGLLTSDRPAQDQERTSYDKAATGDRSMFRFGENNFSSNFNTSGTQDKNPTVFGQINKSFNFHKSTFMPPSFRIQAKDVHNQSLESDAGSEPAPDDDGPHFEPIVPLPEKIEVKTGEEDEEEMFCNRAKLFRFDADTKEWKERGIGNVKILRHVVSGKIRLLMRREQVLKICANHYITADMKLKPNATSDKSYVWHAYDYADEMPKPEQLAIRFKTVDEAALFKKKFEDAQRLLTASESKAVPTQPRMQKDSYKNVGRPSEPLTFGSQFAMKEGEWQCDCCLAMNSSASTVCVCCQMQNKNKTSSNSGLDLKQKTATGSVSMPSFTFGKDNMTKKPVFGEQMGGGIEQWTCSKCSLKNDKSVSQCASCKKTNSAKNVDAQPTKLAGFKNVTSTQGKDLTAAFGKKAGQWDCNVCCVRNESSAVKCVCCQNTNPLVKEKPVPKATTNVSNSQKDIVARFEKKDGQWDCNTCLVRNEASASNCVSCQITNPQAASKDPVPPVQTPGFNHGPGTDVTRPSSLSHMFSRKQGQWDCNTCLVRNEASASNCVSCQSPNPQTASKDPVPPVQTPGLNHGPGTDVTRPSSLSHMFSRKDGQWDCNTCLVRNEPSASTCVSCQSPNPQAASKDPAPSIQSPGFKHGFGTDFTRPSSLSHMFSRKDGQWDCNTCLVRNEESKENCVACKAPNPTAKPNSAASQSKPSFTFGIKDNSSQSFAQPTTGFKCDLSGKDFKFGTSEAKVPSFSFKTTATSEETKTAKGGFNFAVPSSSGNFKFGISEPNKKNEISTGSMKDILGNGKVAAEVSEPSGKAEENNPENVLGQSMNSFSFADLAKTSTEDDFPCIKADPNFKGFSRAGEKLFMSQKHDQTTALAAEQECVDEFYKTEDRDDIHFDPIVQLPDKVDLVTGEEDEKTLYSQRVKLFRFDTDIGQWKERGVGQIKILKNEVNGKLRMLMRREQVLKVCTNHWITTTMNLKPLTGSDRAWMWMANDFSDGDAKLEQLAVKFKTPEQAEDFKSKFDECQRLLLDIPLQTPHKLVDTGRTAHLIQKAEEMKSGLKDLKTFLTDKVKSLDDTSENNATGLEKKIPADSTEPTFEWDTYDMRGDALDGNLDDSIYASPLACSPEKKNLFRFGESTTGFNFSFQPSPSASKSPTKLNQSRVSVGTDEESDVTQEEERDGQYFEPVVPLPDLVEITSGEENEETLFCHRAKLYRFDKSANQWKERGIGDLKILQSFDTKSARVVMRRDQVLKLCANHRITPDINIQPMKGAERAWVWTAHDFAEGEGKVECFAARFKLQEVADLFKEVFEEAKEAQAKDCLLTPVSSRGTTPRASPCGKAAVAILEETTREGTSKQLEEDSSSYSQVEPGSSPTEKPSKAVVSPPKFVFGSDVVKNIFSSEKQMPFTFGNTSSTGSLFGFSFSASKSQNNETQKQPSNISAPEISSVSQNPSLSVQNPTIPSSTISTGMQPMPARGFNFSLFKSNPAAFWTCTSPSKPEVEAKTTEPSEADSTDDVIIVYERTPTQEQRALAEELYLPITFFCYKNNPGYISEESEVDDEDFETAVKNLNGILYPDNIKDKASGRRQEYDQECLIVWEKKPTAQEKAKAERLMLPPTFFCGISSDTDEDKENQEDFDTEVRKVKEAKGDKKVVSSSSEVTRVSAFGGSISPPPLKGKLESSSSCFQDPVDLSSKPEQVKADSTKQGFSAVNFSCGLIPFLEYTNFQWANTGAAVFGSHSHSKKEEDENGSDDEVVHSEDVHFEPIVSLPEKAKGRLNSWQPDLKTRS
ncbi:hypothetical protein GDO86_003996 [Hymenochirus boettgeri]|uniref:E3 SUMO-protein ligase RanBP2 n=1 Tax=Hymenochirus boettgeri TaxID=247094 RepID=A0A8T2K852_9PIPI|nr:hypothetical protein GDO86_003996 [Hymenochirus boettgeri]